jgi:long-chain acyl-CoA synthetase
MLARHKRDTLENLTWFPPFQGLTEACAICGVQEQDDFRYGNQGVVIPSMEIKLVSFPELKDVAGQPMLSTDRFDVLGNPILGRGEFYVKGANVAAGYYMRPDETKEMIDQDGWLRTGHIGRFMPDGTISIVYRKKNLVKLKGGDYIALEIMEGVYIHSAFVDRICCYGDGDMDRAVALIEPNQAHTMKWAKEHGISGSWKMWKICSRKLF